MQYLQYQLVHCIYCLSVWENYLFGIIVTFLNKIRNFKRIILLDIKTLSSLFRSINTSGEPEIYNLSITACPDICFFFKYLSNGGVPGGGGWGADTPPFKSLVPFYLSVKCPFLPVITF